MNSVLPRKTPSATRRGLQMTLNFSSNLAYRDVIQTVYVLPPQRIKTKLAAYTNSIKLIYFCPIKTNHIILNRLRCSNQEINIRRCIRMGSISFVFINRVWRHKTVYTVHVHILAYICTVHLELKQ